MKAKVLIRCPRHSLVPTRDHRGFWEMCELCGNDIDGTPGRILATPILSDLALLQAADDCAAVDKSDWQKYTSALQRLSEAADVRVASEEKTNG